MATPPLSFMPNDKQKRRQRITKKQEKETYDPTRQVDHLKPMREAYKRPTKLANIGKGYV